MPQAKSNMGRNLIVAISAVLIIVILVGTGYLMLMGSAKKKT